MREALTEHYLAAKRIAMHAVDLADVEREQFIAAEAGSDDALKAEVRWMLAAMTQSGLPQWPLIVQANADLSGGDAEAAAPSHYRLLNQLGEGGMGVVYLAERDDGGYVQLVALKLLGAAAEGSPILVERFARERQMLALLDHPAIARLLDGGVFSNGKPFLAMEYVDGDRIDRWCDRHKLDLRARLVLFLKVCEAVEYAHRHLIIHRDIKPANILVKADGTPKLLDFGIARLLDAETVDAVTATGQHAMSVSYASPEQIACKLLTTTTDVYSLAAVLYQLVAGTTPFAATGTPIERMNAILDLDPPPPSSQAQTTRRVPADIDSILLKALRKEPAERYGSVAALAADLQRHLDGRPVEARRGQRLYRADRFVRRHRWPVLATALVIALGAAFLADRAHYLHQVEAERNKALALSGFMTQLFANAAPAEAKGENVTVRAMLDRGTADLSKRTDIDPVTKADLLSTMGQSYMGLHLWQQAQVPLQEAQNIFDHEDAPLVDRVRMREDLAEAANFLGENAKGVAISREGQQLLSSDKERYFQQWANLRLLELSNQSSQSDIEPTVLIPKLHALATSIEKRKDPFLRTTLGDIYTTLAALQERTGDLDGALASVNVAVRHGDYEGADPEVRLTLRASQARYLIVHGDVAQGVARLESLDRDYVRLVGADTMTRAESLNNLSVALQKLGRSEQAIEVGARSVAIAHHAGGDDNRLYLQIAVGQAMELLGAQRFDEAEALIKKVLPALESKVGPGNGAVNYAYGLNALARIQLSGHNDPAAAIATLEQSRQVMKNNVDGFLVVYEKIPQYTAQAWLVMRKPVAAAKALDDYQAVLDSLHDAADSRWRKRLANMRASLELGKVVTTN
jgi:tRNA A-37 threonylcarbamoyl transferase component Bud32/tetratricopeptide (TPR) repeat protein